uniref:Uncharacterized protein n=1 Tax=Trichogramma kaykai TaxID=54128 RepID=A0ABD2X4B7_9HYME
MLYKSPSIPRCSSSTRKADVSAVLGERERGLEIVCHYQIKYQRHYGICAHAHLNIKDNRRIIVRTRWSGLLLIERRCQSMDERSKHTWHTVGPFSGTHTYNVTCIVNHSANF